MTIDEAIKHCNEVAEQNETQAQKIGRQLVGSAIDKYATDCRECAADHRQLAEWLTELKELKNSIGAVKLSNMKEALELIQAYKAENAALISECDRLIKEKGELLSKVSGGDVLRICQLENQLQVELDNSHCLEIELTEAKRLLKAAMEDMNTLYEAGKDEGCIGIKFKWRFADEALKLIGGEADEEP